MASAGTPRRTWRHPGARSAGSDGAGRPRGQLRGRATALCAATATHEGAADALRKRRRPGGGREAAGRRRIVGRAPRAAPPALEPPDPRRVGDGIVAAAVPREGVSSGGHAPLPSHQYGGSAGRAPDADGVARQPGAEGRAVGAESRCRGLSRLGGTTSRYVLLQGSWCTTPGRGAGVIQQLGIAVRRCRRPRRGHRGGRCQPAGDELWRQTGGRESVSERRATGAAKRAGTESGGAVEPDDQPPVVERNDRHGARQTEARRRPRARPPLRPAPGRRDAAWPEAAARTRVQVRREVSGVHALSRAGPARPSQSSRMGGSGGRRATTLDPRAEHGRRPARGARRLIGGEDASVGWGGRFGRGAGAEPRQAAGRRARRGTPPASRDSADCAGDQRANLNAHGRPRRSGPANDERAAADARLELGDRGAGPPAGWRIRRPAPCRAPLPDDHGGVSPAPRPCWRRRRRPREWRRRRPGRGIGCGGAAGRRGRESGARPAAESESAGTAPQALQEPQAVEHRRPSRAARPVASGWCRLPRGGCPAASLSAAAPSIAALIHEPQLPLELEVASARAMPSASQRQARVVSFRSK